MDASDDSKGFFKHVFNFDDHSKAEILNILQYSMLAIIPVVMLNKTMQKYVPEPDDKKSTLEISAEIVIQIIVMFIGLLLINRMVIYVPTYSDAKYPEFHIMYIVLAVLMITMSLQTKLGEKVTLLTDRIYELWEGKTTTNTKKKGTVKVSQPISGQTTTNTTTEGTAISSLPTYDGVYGGQNTIQPMPNYDSMYKQDNTPLVGAASPTQEGFYNNEPMAANAVLGGSSFGTW